MGAFVGSRGEESPQEAVQRLHSTIGPKLAIDHQYHEWDSPFPTPQETWSAARGMLPFLNWKARRLDGETL